MKTLIAFAALLTSVLSLSALSSAAITPQTVTFPSGATMLHGLLYKPDGPGPFPAVLYNHGSARGMLSNEAFEAIAPVYTSRGWVFFAPYRRGQGLSAAAGPYILDKQNAAYKTGGIRAAAATAVKLLETDHLDDQLAALAWLKKQSFVETNRIAVAGNSYGGIEVVLGAQRVNYCAAIDASGGAESWSIAPELQTRMIAAVRNSKAPIFFFQAENDYSIAPSRVLSAAMKDVGKIAEMKIYPPLGNTAADGHSFTWLGTAKWAGDVFAFLDKYCRKENGRDH
jgi:carboxymethylenebutenolidase